MVESDYRIQVPNYLRKKKGIGLRWEKDSKHQYGLVYEGMWGQVVTHAWIYTQGHGKGKRKVVCFTSVHGIDPIVVRCSWLKAKTLAEVTLRMHGVVVFTDSKE